MQLSNEISQEEKPGVGECQFRLDGKIFAVGGEVQTMVMEGIP